MQIPKKIKILDRKQCKNEENGKSLKLFIVQFVLDLLCLCRLEHLEYFGCGFLGKFQNIIKIYFYGEKLTH